MDGFKLYWHSMCMLMKSRLQYPLSFFLQTLAQIVMQGGELLAVLLIKKVFPHPFAMFCLSVVLAGAVGNLIDRALLGYVTDMFETLFMRFAVFNVADICVVVGGIAFCVYYLFFHGKEEGHGADSAAG